MGFVLSLNLHRRHLDASQRAVVAAKALPHFEEEAKERQRIGGREKGKANLPEAAKGQARDKAAETLNVSPRSVESANKVLHEATPELVAAVDQRKTKVSVAAEVASLPPDEQRQIVAKGEREILAAAKEIRARKLEEERRGHESGTSLGQICPRLLCE